MKISEIANSIDHRHIIRKIMIDKKWPAGLVKEIEDEWIVGMGCDDERGHCRNLSAIYSL